MTATVAVTAASDVIKFANILIFFVIANFIKHHETENMTKRC